LWDETYNPASAYITVINNLVYGTNRTLWWGAGAKGASLSGMNHHIIANNTLVNSSSITGVQLGDSSIHNSSVFENNIIEQDGTTLPVIIYPDSPGIRITNNLLSKSPITSFGPDNPGNFIANPLLTKTGSTDAGLLTGDWFKLMSGSPAIDKALVLSQVTDDYFGTARPIGSVPDIGAHEYGTGITPTTPPTPTAPTGKPGDTNGDGYVDGVDYVIWLNHYNQSTTSGPGAGDFNSDGNIDGIDYVIWLNNYGT
jgi:hypothetical protein